ncbi:MAG: hypothetical protein Q4G66_04090 [bacterium]|nr:hypothetical protein [bacterium]
MPSGRFEAIIVKERGSISIPKPRLFSWVGYIFFFLMLIVPTTYQIERGILLVVLLFNCFVFVLLRSWRLASHIRNWAFATITTSILFIFLGLLNDAPGAIRVSSVFVAWPILYVFFIGILHTPNKFFPFYRVILIAVIVASMMGIMVVAEKLFGINLFITSIFEEQGASFGSFEGVVAYRLYNMTTVIYGLPFLLATVLLPRDRSPFKGKWRLAALLGLCLAVVSLLVSGRRAFWLIAGLSPVIIWALMVGVRMKTLRLNRIVSLIFLCFFLVVVSPFFGVDLQMVWKDFLRAFDITDMSNLSSYLRREQFFALLEGWFASPLIGNGLGAAASGSLRSVDQPWAYELSYMALLFHTGLIGVFVYSSAVTWVFCKSIKVMRTNPVSVTLLFPVLTGLSCFLIANATNPYLGKFDYLWVLFLPVGVLNAYLLKEPRSI